MAPVDEKGAIWEFDPPSSSWTLLSPASTSGLYPEARSYHCMATDGHDTIYIHAGCPEKGRLTDLWAFNVSSRTWKELAPAPEPARGGTSIAFVDGLLYRMNGFDGKTEQGGNLDIYAPETNTWSSLTYAPDGQTGPGARSVAVLLAVKIGGKSHLVTLFGERDPSALGHQGAGKMLSDAWAFDIENKTWMRVDAQGDTLPAARGWFTGDVLGEDKVLVQGGLGESNQRLGDAWILSF